MFPRYILLSLLTATVMLLLMAEHAKAYDEPYCREFTRDIRVGGKIQEGYGTACMQPDGAWKIVAEDGQTLPNPVPFQDNSYLLKRRMYETPDGYSSQRYGYSPSRVNIDFGFYDYDYDYHRHQRNRWHNERNWRHHQRHGGGH